MNASKLVAAALLAGIVVSVSPQPSLARKPHYFGAVADVAAPTASGVPLRAVTPGSPADKAGLQAGDVIVKLGNVPIRTAHDLERALEVAMPDTPVEVIYLRHGQQHRTTAALEPRR